MLQLGFTLPAATHASSEHSAAALPEYRHLLIMTGMENSEPDLVSLRSRFDNLGLEHSSTANRESHREGAGVVVIDLRAATRSSSVVRAPV